MSVKYLPRILGADLEKYLTMIGAILIVGPKWWGKTTTAEQHSHGVLKLQDKDNYKSKYDVGRYWTFTIIKRGQTMFNRWMAGSSSISSLARNNSALVKDQTIIDDMNANFMDISRPTYYSYIGALKRLFVIEDLSGGLKISDPNLQSAQEIKKYS